MRVFLRRIAWIALLLSVCIADAAAKDLAVVSNKSNSLQAIALADLVRICKGQTNHPAIVVVDSDESLVQKVESIPGAVGVVDVYSITSGVTVLKVAGKSPFGVGYLLHGN